MARPLSEDGKVWAMALLFPIFWPFIPVLIVCAIGEGIRNLYYDWKYKHDRRAD
jgi:hypothetical protein